MNNFVNQLFFNDSSSSLHFKKLLKFRILISSKILCAQIGIAQKQKCM